MTKRLLCIPFSSMTCLVSSFCKLIWFSSNSVKYLSQLKLGSGIGATLLHVIWILHRHMCGGFKTSFLVSTSWDHVQKIQQLSRSAFQSSIHLHLSLSNYPVISSILFFLKFALDRFFHVTAVLVTVFSYPLIAEIVG